MGIILSKVLNVEKAADCEYDRNTGSTIPVASPIPYSDSTDKVKIVEVTNYWVWS